MSSSRCSRRGRIDCTEAAAIFGQAVRLMIVPGITLLAHRLRAFHYGVLQQTLVAEFSFRFFHFVAAMQDHPDNHEQQQYNKQSIHFGIFQNHADRGVLPVETIIPR